MGFQEPWLYSCLLWATVAILLVPPVVTQELRGTGLGLGNWNNNAGIPGSSEDLSTEYGHHIHSHGAYQGEKDRHHREEDEDFSREYGHQGPCVATVLSATDVVNVKAATVMRRTWGNTVTSVSTANSATSARWSVTHSALQEATLTISPPLCIKLWLTCWRRKSPDLATWQEPHLFL
ncbi:histidine rich calcium binding protein, isoform CRA_c [Rattus norvegicus]|uniref:Histidine rich calcium binding protein, isoform CRA_c n=1 Tax=Rattus norvegicus TaxID=10116 RepID=A6JB07_RAT|nr:histidine rich calcium binding protein, isoform CRA_c [Rattus norvegicus]